MNPALKTLQLLIGLMLGAIALAGIVSGAGYYLFVTQMSVRPPKPVFAEERGGGKVATKPTAAAKATGAKAATNVAAATKPQDPNAPQKLPPDAFDAKVLWKDGVSLKKEPISGAQKVGGVAFNGKVAIIKTSDDKQWVLVRSQMDNAEGWVKAGNIDKAAAALDNNDNEEAKEEAPAPKPRRRARVRRRQVESQDDDN